MTLSFFWLIIQWLQALGSDNQDFPAAPLRPQCVHLYLDEDDNAHLKVPGTAWGMECLNTWYCTLFVFGEKNNKCYMLKKIPRSVI